jgi:long-chain-fatty-acid--[acyl-carrier-protein] ligase
VEGSDRGSNPQVTLFSVNELDLSEVNKYLRDSGVATIAKIRDIKLIDEIPMLGSGKTNYRVLKELVEQNS